MGIRRSNRGGRTPGDVAVIYLARGVNEPDTLAKFLESYCLHRAGFPHELVVTLKGYSDLHLQQRHADLVISLGATPLVLDKDDGFDLAAYRRSAQMLQHAYIVCLNSFSEILVDDWLQFLLRALMSPGTGLVGATGSWESISSTTFRGLSSHPDEAQRLKLSVLLRGMKEYVLFPRFPNVHVRSNGFAIRRKDFLELRWPDDLENKESLHALESGRAGFTRQIQAKGMKVAVVGADGKSYAPRDWSSSRTFRLGEQENLLISDNRTRDFSQASQNIRDWLTLTTWNVIDEQSRKAQ